MPETINGLPLHPLVVHAPVVLIPLVLVLTVIILVRQAWRRSLGWWTVLLAGAATLAAAAAASTGEDLAAVVGQPLRHASLGEGLPFFAAAMAVTVTLYVVAGAFVDWRRRRTSAPKPLAQGAAPAPTVLPAASVIEDPSVADGTTGIPPVPAAPTAVKGRKERAVPLPVTILGVLAVLVAAAATVQTFRVGESGAQAVWGGKLAAAQESATGSASPSASAPSTRAVIPMSEVTQHATGKDCWTVIDGTVYNLTSWVEQHPGGTVPILTLCGTDGTSSFTTQHGGQTRPDAELAQFAIGTVR